MGIKELREQTGLTQQKFADYFGIPVSTMRNWEYGVCECNQYILDMMEYKLKGEGLIEVGLRTFEVKADVLMRDMTVDEARKRIMDALKEAGAKSFILTIE